MNTSEQTIFGVPVTGPSLLNTAEASELLSKSTVTIALMEAGGELEVHRRDVERSHRKITRRSVIAHLAKTVNQPETHPETVDAIVYLVGTLSDALQDKVFLQIAADLPRSVRRALAAKLLREGMR